MVDHCSDADPNGKKGKHFCWREPGHDGKHKCVCPKEWS